MVWRDNVDIGINQQHYFAQLAHAQTKPTGVFLMGAFGFAVFNALLYATVHTAGALNIGIIQWAIPAFILLSAYLVFGATASWLQFLGVIVTLIGVCIVAFITALPSFLA